MKNFFKKLGIRKMDEMENAIALKAQRVAIVYVMLMLFCWTLYESYKVYTHHTDLNPFPCFLLVSTTLVQNISQYILIKKATKGCDESEKQNKDYLVVLIISLVLVFLGAIITLGTIG